MLLLCRICLESGATYPIFLNKVIMTKCSSIHSMFLECFGEKIEDVKGYPKNICVFCKDKLEVAYNLVIKFKKSTNILKNNLVAKIKVEDDSDDNTKCDSYSEVMVPSVKSETEDQNSVDNIEEHHDSSSSKLHETFQDKKNSFDQTPMSNNKSCSKKPKSIKTSVQSSCKGTVKCQTQRFRNFKIKNKDSKIKKLQTNRSKLKIDHNPKLCETCGEEFDCLKKLNTHKLAHRQTAQKCPICNKEYTNHANLKRHIARIHEDEKNKNRICSYCSKRFTFTSDLNCHVKAVHMPKKRKNKIFSCNMCDKIYHTKIYLEVHQRSAHTGERPWECSYCNKSFSCKQYLTFHVRLHTGDAPHKCPICDRGYAQPCNMKSHLRNHRISQIDPEILKNIKPALLKFFKP